MVTIFIVLPHVLLTTFVIPCSYVGQSVAELSASEVRSVDAKQVAFHVNCLYGPLIVFLIHTFQYI